MGKWLNGLPERIQFLLLLLIAPTIFAVFWFQGNVLFPEPDCTICGPLTAEEQRWLDEERERDIDEILRELTDATPALSPNAN